MADAKPTRSSRRYRRDRQQRPSSARASLCTREGDRVFFDARITAAAASDAIACLSRARHDGLRGLTLDFSRTQRAYPEGMVQIVAHVDHLRRQGMHFDLVAPSDRGLASVFEASNWAHVINPAMYDPSPYRGDAQMPIRRYGSGAEQQHVVNEAMEVVLHQMELERSSLAGLEWALNEITDNVLNHADAPAGGLVQVATFRDQRRIQFAVADGGRGVYRSMREGHPELRNDREAIGEALKQGVTRSAEVGQGNGLAGALRIATYSMGSFVLASGASEVRVIPREGALDHEERTIRREGARRFRGTFVFMEMRTDAPLSLQDALDFGRGRADDWDYLDAIRADEPDFTIDVAQEAVGFGSRESGRALRTKIDNLLRADSAARLLLRWDGVPLVSSSFADEVLGRLFVQLGPVQFAARVRSVGMDPIVQDLVDRAILQRAAQSAP